MLNHRCAERCLLNVRRLIHVLLLELITSALVCSEIALHIVRGTKEDGQLMRLSFLKLKSALWENNLFPFLLDMKETYFDIALLLLFRFFIHAEILLILSVYLLLMLCVHSSTQCACQSVCVGDFMGICLYLNGLMSVVCSLCMG